MTSNNTTPESREEQVNKVKSNQQNLYTRLVQKFVGEKLKNKSERFPFAKKISQETSISPETLEEIKKFAGKNPEFDGLEINEQKIQIPALQREVGVYIKNIQKKNMQLREIFLREYTISPSQYDDILHPEIEALESEVELNNLLASSQARKKFLQKKNPKNTPVLRDIFAFLAGFNLEQKYNNLPEGKKEGFYMTVKKMQRAEKISAEDVWELFESWAFSPSEKQKLIENFIPSMSLKKAVDIWLFSADGAKSLKKKLLKKTIDDSLFSTESEFDFYVDQIDESDVFFSTVGVFERKEAQDKLIDTNFFVNDFIAEYNEMISQIQEKFEQKSVQTLPEMLEQLRNYSHISWLSLFGVGSTIIFHQKLQNANGIKEDVKIFAEISSISDKWYFTVLERGNGEYDNTIKKVSRLTYSDFLQYVTQGNGDTTPDSVEIISDAELKKRIVDKDIHDLNSTLQLTDKYQVQSSVTELRNRINTRKKELKEARGMSKEEIEQDPEIQELYRQIDAQNISLQSLDELNLTALKKRLSELDASGDAFGFEKGTTFELKSWKKTDAFTITDIDQVGQKITLIWIWEAQTISYAEFTQNFEKQNAKRSSNIKNFDSLFVQGDKAYRSWWDYELKDGKIQKKSLKWEYNFNFLVPPDGENPELIQIHEIQWDTVVVSFWEVKDEKEEKHDDHGHHHDDANPKIKKQKFVVENQKYTLTLGVLDSFIRKWSLWPRTTDDGKVRQEEAEAIPKNKKEWNFMSAFFKNMSIAEVMKGGEMFLEQFSKMLEEGQEHKAGHFAVHTLGRFLPRESLIDLQSRIEAHEKHEMDEHLDRLKGINSALSTEIIENWLLDPNCPEYKKEAGLMYMMEKYGALCAKWPLYKYKGKFFWYQALWGSVNPPDSNFVEVMESNRKLNLNVSEELLVYELIRRQTNPRTHGYNGVHRRSKLDKELKAMRGKGKEEEMDVGRKDGGNERDIMKRVGGWLSEMSSGNYPNAIGWLETAVNKWGPMHVMNKIPFVMMFSGMAYEFEQDLTDVLKNFPNNSRLLPMLRFISYQRDIDLVNDTIIEICKNLEKRGGEFSGILGRAQDIYSKQKDRTIEEWEKQETTKKFYDAHNGLWGKAITDALYMLNTGDSDDTLSKMIFFEKDNQEDENGKEIPGTGNEVFQRYYNLLHGYLRADGDFGKDEWLMSDAFAEKGTSGMDMYRAASQLFLMKMWSFAKGDSAQSMWSEIRKEFEAIPKRKYHQDPIKNKRMQEKILEENLRFLIAGIMTTNNDSRGLGYFNAPNSATNKLNNWWVYLNDFAILGANKDSLLAGKHSDLIQKFVKQIMESELTGRSFKRPVRLLPNGTYEILWEENKNSQPWIWDLIGNRVWKIMTDAKRGAQVEDIINTAKRGARNYTGYENVDDFVE